MNEKKMMIEKRQSLLFPLLLVFYEIATYLSNDMYLPALPQMINDLGLSTLQAQLTLTCWFLGSACMPLIMGMVSDRFGRKTVLLTGGVIYILATLLAAMTSHVYLFLVARTLQGAMVPSMLVPGYACIHEMYVQHEAIRMLALMGSISVLAPALGPLLGSLVLYVTDWRMIFWVIALWSAIALLLLCKWMPETGRRAGHQPIQWRPLLGSYYRVISNRKYMQLMVVLGFCFAGWLAWITASPILIISNFHFSPLAFGIIQAVLFSAYIFGNRCVKYMLHWLGVRHLINTGLALIGCGGALLLIVSILMPSSIFPFLVAMTVYSFGSALCFAPLNRSIIEASTEPMSIRVALFTVFLTGFAALGSAMASLFFTGSLFSIGFVIAVAALLTCLLKIGTD